MKTASSNSRRVQINFACVWLVSISSCIQVAVDPVFFRGTVMTPSFLHILISQVSQYAVLAICLALIFTHRSERVNQYSLPTRLIIALITYLSAITLFYNQPFFSYVPGLVMTISCSLCKFQADKVVILIIGTSSLVTVGSLIFLAAEPAYAFMQVNTGRETFLGLQLAGLTPHPNSLGLFAGIAFGMVILSKKYSFARKLLLLLMFGFAALATGSRLCILLVVLSIVYVLIGKLIKSKNGENLATVTILLFIFAGLVLALDGNFSLDSTLNGRIQIWADYIDFWQSTGFFGGGLGASKSIIQASQYRVTQFNGAQGHNEFVGELAQGGLIAVSLIILFLFYLYKRVSKIVVSEKIPLLFFILSLILASMVEQILVLDAGARLSLFLALVMLSKVEVHSDQNSLTLKRNYLPLIQ